MDPALGMHDVGHACAASANGELETPTRLFPAQEIVLQRADLVLAVYHELHVVPRGEPEIAVAVFVGDLAYLTEVRHAHQTASAHAHRVTLVSCFRHMNQDSGLQDLVVQPLSIVILDDWRVKL
jgi:hypothetical protein